MQTNALDSIKQKLMEANVPELYNELEQAMKTRIAKTNDRRQKEFWNTTLAEQIAEDIEHSLRSKIIKVDPMYSELLPAASKIVEALKSVEAEKNKVKEPKTEKKKLGRPQKVVAKNGTPNVPSNLVDIHHKIEQQKDKNGKFERGTGRVVTTDLEILEGLSEVLMTGANVSAMKDRESFCVAFTWPKGKVWAISDSLKGAYSDLIGKWLRTVDDAQQLT